MTTDRSSAPTTAPAQQSSAEVDIKLLAEKVYRLMLADLRLEQARGARPGKGGRK